MAQTPFEILLTCAPGLEKALADEAAAHGFAVNGRIAGGVTVTGAWPDVWRANLVLRGANAVLARIGQFRAAHVSELDKRARKFPWNEFLPRGANVSVSASCKASRIYHSGAARQRVETALRDEAGAVIGDDAEIEILARIEKDMCTLSLNTSGALLHKRGAKEAIGKAPMRETIAALFLRECGFRGTEPVLDPMCGSGTFVIEAAEIATDAQAGRARHFAFEKLKTFDKAVFATMKQAAQPTTLRFHGFDRDKGAIAGATQNAARAGLSEITHFTHQPIGALMRPDGAPGLVITNPPYGARIGEKKKLLPLYQTFGRMLREKFQGWRVGLITNDEALARATGLPFKPPSPPVLHGGIRIRLWQTSPLP